MKYYISPTGWNLLESFATESISPYSFYRDRNYGNNLSRYVNKLSDSINHLILHTEDPGGDYTIIVSNKLLDMSCLESIKGTNRSYSYSKTIYYHPKLTSFRFSSEELKTDLIAESTILFEVKCINKYMGCFSVEKVPQKDIYYQIDSLSFNHQKEVQFDNFYDVFKGAIVGYCRGLASQNNAGNMSLMKQARDLKNNLAGLHTQVMTSTDGIKRPESIIEKIQLLKQTYLTQQKDKTNSFELLQHNFNELVRLANLRHLELSRYQAQDSILQMELEINDIQEKLVALEKNSGISQLRQELNVLKEQEKQRGLLEGKTRKYFEKGSYEYKKKKWLAEQIKNFENREDVTYLSKQLKSLKNKEKRVRMGSSEYDTIISAMFIRLSDIMNDLIKRTNSNNSNTGKIDFANIFINDQGVMLESTCGTDAEISYFNILINTIIQDYPGCQISDDLVLQIMATSANKFKEKEISSSDEGKMIIDCLRQYWKYKNLQADGFLIPEGMPVFQSVMSFFIKFAGFDQIERFLLNKGYTQKQYAFMLWGACKGYANLPKTFTNILYENSESEIMDDYLINFISTNQ